MATGWVRSTGLALALLVSGSLHGQTPAPAPPAEPAADKIALEPDATARMTVPVSIGGSGPYRFIVDTGAERTLIAQELAGRLSLAAGPVARVHSMSEVSDVATVVIPRLQVSARAFRNIHAPAFSRYNLGAEGVLGVDSLKAQRVVLDFANQTMSVSPSRNLDAVTDPDTIVVTARNRFGRLILADARVEGQKLWVVIDTGSEVTVGNEALRRKLASKGRLAPLTPIQLISVTGGRITAGHTQIRGASIGRIRLRNMPVAFADVHPFHKLGLTERPAILLGMDVLGHFDQVAIDFANRDVRFTLPGGPAGPRLGVVDR
jgi:predicted aspartyl protease